tara:strand:- start:3333 stop:3734 length:402 start_codon:yes stop_codon:yes gene_type:complete
MLRVDEVACRLACSTRTVRRWLADGSLRSVKVNGLRLIHESAFKQLVGNSDLPWLDENVSQVAAGEVISAPALNPSLNLPLKTNPKTETLKQADLFESTPVSEISTANIRLKSRDLKCKQISSLNDFGKAPGK